MSIMIFSLQFKISENINFMTYKKHHFGKLSNCSLLSSCHCFITVEKAFLLIHMRLSFSGCRTGRENPIFFYFEYFAGLSHCVETTTTTIKKFSFIVHNYEIHLAKATNICEIVLSNLIMCEYMCVKTRSCTTIPSQRKSLYIYSHFS